MKNFVLWFFLSFVLMGCAHSDKDFGVSSVAAVPQGDQLESVARKWVKEGTLQFRTSDNEKTYQLITQSLKGFGAYISEESTISQNNRSGYQMTIRVPAERFDSLFQFIVDNARIRELDKKAIQIRDVTEEYIDIQARLKIKKESELKLTELLQQSRVLSETLEIQKQLTDLRAEIESIEGRLNFVSDQVQFSTLRVSFYETVKYSTRFLGDFWDAMKDGWQVFLHVLTLLAYLWAVILLFFVVLFGYKFYRRRKKEF